MSHYFYCPVCGQQMFPDGVRCPKCYLFVTPIKSTYDAEYYRKKSLEKYGDYTHYAEFLEPELKSNPLFDEQKYNQIVTQEEYAERRKQMDYKIPTYFDTDSSQHIPHCPACGSTKIEKISTARKAASQIMFGIFSSTIGKTFICKNCGMKF